MTYDQIFDDERDNDVPLYRAIHVDALEIDDETLTDTDLMVMLSGMVGGVRELHAAAG